MGSSFENILIEAAEPDALRRGLIRALKTAGLIPADEGEDADCTFRLYGAEGDKFWTLVGETLSGNVHELAGKLAKALKRRAIVASCVDSDVLIMSLTKGGAFSTVCVEDPEGYDIEPGPYRAAPWKELVGEDCWEAFRAAVEDQYVCADEALQPLAKLVGYRYEDSVRYFGDPGEPLLECRFKRRVEHPWYLPDDLPPTFQPSGFRHEQGSLMTSFFSRGGQGRGVELLLVANGFDADELGLSGVRFTRNFYNLRERRDIEAVPKRVRIDDGRTGWVAAFLEAEILPGDNPNHPKARTLEGLERRSHREYYVTFLLPGGWLTKLAEHTASSKAGLALDIYLAPMQNREGGASMRVGVDRPEGNRFPLVPKDNV